MSLSLAERLAEAPPEIRERWLSKRSPDEAAALLRDWKFVRRPEQAPPERTNLAGVSAADWWRWWVIVTGRGWGKNRTASEWIVDRCERFAAADHQHLIGLIGQNNDDVKAVQIRGDSGLRAVVKRRGHIWDGSDSTLEPRIGIRREDGSIHWSQIEIHTAEEPNGPRGRNFHTIWFDELAAYKHKVDVTGNTVFTNAELALRAACPVGMIPQAVVTTTPKPIPVIRSLVAGEHGPTQVTRGSMYDNRSNLDPEFISAIRRKYEGTRLADQEIEGAIIDSVEGALWTPALIQAHRVGTASVPRLSKIAIGLDPSGSEEGDYCGIVATGLAKQRDEKGRQHGYVLEDASVQNRPEVWGAALSKLYHELAAKHPNVPIRVAAEVNFGAALVVDVIHLIDSSIPVDEVRATRGKRIRAEPVALVYDSGQWHHVGTFPMLEEQMCLAAGTLVLTPSGDKPIELIRPGDLVATRDGWRPVRQACRVGVRETVAVTLTNGTTMRCTPEHPLWVAGEGWTPAGEVQTAARLLECRALRSARSSSSVASATSSTRTATTRRAAAAADGSTTGICTRRSIALSQRPGRSTTLTTIAATTNRRTWSPSLWLPIEVNTLDARTPPRSDGRSAIELPGGGSDAIQRHGRAGCAAPSSPRPDSEPHFAPTVAVSRVAASGVTESVYDLSVAGCHEFVAGGVLVHNTFWTPLDPTSPDRMDALVWSAIALLPDLSRPPSQYAKGFAGRRAA